MESIKELLKQPYWVIALLVGAIFVALPCITFDKDWHPSSHNPTTFWLFGVGIALVLISTASFVFTVFSEHKSKQLPPAGDPKSSQVRESDGIMSVEVSGCEIRVENGRVENHWGKSGVTIVLPCNEYFDLCVDHPNSALGSFVAKNF
jgi:hypothetical protein